MPFFSFGGPRSTKAFQAGVVSGPTRPIRVFDKNPFTRKLSPRTGDYMASEDGVSRH